MSQSNPLPEAVLQKSFRKALTPEQEELAKIDTDVAKWKFNLLRSKIVSISVHFVFSCFNYLQKLEWQHMNFLYAIRGSLAPQDYDSNFLTKEQESGWGYSLFFYLN
jgi:hypothetical protein